MPEKTRSSAIDDTVHEAIIEDEDRQYLIHTHKDL